MKIGIDISCFLVKRKTGVSWYAYYLVTNLAKIDKENLYILFGCSIGKYKEKFYLQRKIKSENFYISVKILPNKLVSSLQTIFPVEILHGKFDLIHILVQPYYCLNIYGKQIITFHDLGYIIFPSWFHPLEVETFKFAVIRAIRKSDKIITVSNSTKEDLINYFNVKPEKISVVYEGVDDFFHRVEDKERIENIKRKYGIYKKYLLCVCTVEPKKNHIRLVNTFAKIKEKIPDYQLVICGKLGWKKKEFLKKLNELPVRVRKDIVLTNYVPYQDLPLLYSGSDIFIYPSLYEGFGLPILEAMRCGVPVITSNVSSMPEVAGDAALLVNPRDEEEIGWAILKLIEDNELRKKLIEKGLKRSEMFTWENTAKRTLEIYKELS